MREFSLAIFDLREGAKRARVARGETEKDYLESAYKLLHNSGYGKLTERELKDMFTFFPQYTWCLTHFNENLYCREHRLSPCRDCLTLCRCVECVSPGIFRKEERKVLPHRHVQVGSFITAYARRDLNIGQISVERTLAYSNTDGVDSEETPPPELVGGKLGQFKHEADLVDMLYIAAKVYRGRQASGEPILKAKGFSLGKKVKMVEFQNPVYSAESEAKFERATSGEEIESKRMVRAKDYLFKGMGMPYNVHVRKAVRGKMRPKRFFHSNGTTKPWTIDEVRSKWTEEDATESNERFWRCVREAYPTLLIDP